MPGNLQCISLNDEVWLTSVDTTIAQVDDLMGGRAEVAVQTCSHVTPSKGELRKSQRN